MRQLRALLAIVVSAIFLFPLYLVIANAFKTDPEILRSPAKPPIGPTLDGMSGVLSVGDVSGGLVNSLLITGSTIALIMVVSSMLAFALHMSNSWISNAVGAVILFIAKTDTEEISDMAGLNRRSPWLALFITIGLLSLGGIPPAAGFFGKFFLFQAAVNSNLVGLALIAVTNAIIALYYYLVVIKVMYVDIGPDDDKPIAIPRVYGWSLGITALVVILLGTVAVTPIYDWAVLGAAGL